MNELNIYFDDAARYTVMPWKTTYRHFMCMHRLHQEIKRRSKSERNRWRREADLKTIAGIRDLISKGNIRLVCNSVQRFTKKLNIYNMPLDDFISEGHVALMDAIDKFEVKRGWRFSTYVDVVMRTRLRNLLNSQSMVFGRAVNQRIGTMVTARYKLAAIGNNNPTDQEIADWLNENGAPSMRGRWKAPSIKLLGEQKDRQIHCSLDKACGTATIGEFIQDKSQSPTALRSQQSHDANLIWLCIARHTEPRDFDIMRRRILRSEALKEIGEIYNITRERIRQIEAAVIERTKMVVAKRRCSKIPLHALLTIDRTQLYEAIARWSSYPDPTEYTGKYAADYHKTLEEYVSDFPVLGGYLTSAI